MNIIEATAEVKADTELAFKRPSWNSGIYYNTEAKELRWVTSDETVDMTVARIRATDYVVVSIASLNGEEVDEDAEVTCVLEDGRWRTTTNPERHRAAGRKVATFSIESAY